MDNKYKILQVQEVLMSKYGYHLIYDLNSKETKDKEVWLINTEAKYQLIRISCSKASSYNYEKEFINNTIYFCNSTFKTELNFLDIHISDDKYDHADEPYNFINIEDNYCDGVDIVNDLPLLINSIHNEKDSNAAIFKITTQIKEIHNNRKKQLRKKLGDKLAVLYVIIFLCVLNYIVSLYLTGKYSSGVAYIVCGGLYKTFTVGLHEYYRLITYSFVHGGLLHLFFNMYALLSIGTYIILRYDYKKFLFILFNSILIGGLSQLLLFENTICVGMSAGVYGLFLAYIYSIFRDGFIPIGRLMPIIFINISLNFLSQTAWVAHLGGLIGGFISCMIIFADDNNKLGTKILYVVLLVALFAKLLQIKTIQPLFAGTDFEVVKFFDSIGFKDLSNSLLIKLLKVYEKFGG